MRFRYLVLGVAIAVMSSLATWQWTSAQVTEVVPQPPVIDESIKSGADIGFRIQSVNRSKAIGTLVIKVNGRWVDAQSAATYTPLSH